MKNLKKLLPLITLSSTTLFVAPIVTSCTNDQTKATVTWDYTEGLFEYTTESLESQPLSREDATKKYFQAAQANAKIFAEDVTNKMAEMQAIRIYDYGIVPLHVTVSVDKVWYDKDNSVGYASFDVEFNGLCSIYVGETIVDTYADGVANFINIPFKLARVVSVTPWHVEWDFDPPKETTYWNDYLVSVNVSVPAEGMKINDKFEGKNDIPSASRLVNSVSPDYCHYLAYVTEAE